MLISVETHVPGIMGDLREILGIQAPKATTGPVMPGSKSKTAQGPPPMEPRAKKPRMYPHCSMDTHIWRIFMFYSLLTIVLRRIKPRSHVSKG